MMRIILTASLADEIE